MSMQVGLRYIEMNIQLYKNLVNQMNQRKNAAEYVLKNIQEKP